MFDEDFSASVRRGAALGWVVGDRLFKLGTVCALSCYVDKLRCSCIYELCGYKHIRQLLPNWLFS